MHTLLQFQFLILHTRVLLCHLDLNLQSLYSVYDTGIGKEVLFRDSETGNNLLANIKMW